MSYFDGLLHKEHCDQQTEQLSGYPGEPVDDGASSKYRHKEQQGCCPDTDPTVVHEINDPSEQGQTSQTKK